MYYTKSQKEANGQLLKNATMRKNRRIKNMSFKTINTQEELDEVIRDRLHRAEEKYAKYTSPEDLEKLKATYTGYVSPEEVEKIKQGYSSYTSPEDLAKMKSDYDTQLAEIRAENTTLKTSALKSAIASEMNIPASLASRIQGTTEDELRKDALALANVIKAQKPVLPLGGQDTETKKADKNRALRELAQSLTDN